MRNWWWSKWELARRGSRCRALLGGSWVVRVPFRVPSRVLGFWVYLEVHG